MPRFTKRHIDRCVESATYQKTGSLKLDRDAGVVYGVKVLGWSGKGGQRIYQRRAVEEALPHYNGAVVNLNHVANDGPSDMSVPNRDVTMRFGRIKDPFIREDGLCGNLKFNTKHPWADAFCWFVENDPEAIGLSHDAILQGPLMKDGKRSIESIPKVFSVDIVADPGSTKGLREDMTPDEEHTDASVDMDDLDQEGDDAEEHLCSYIVSILKDKSLPMKERRAKVVDAMNMMDDEEEGDEDDSEEPESEDEEMKPETKATESSALTDAERLELEDFRREKVRRVTESKAREKCNVADLDEDLVTDTFVNILVRANESEWDTIIADRKLKITPKSTTPAPVKNKQLGIEDFEKHLLGGK